MTSVNGVWPLAKWNYFYLFHAYTHNASWHILIKLSNAADDCVEWVYINKYNLGVKMIILITRKKSFSGILLPTKYLQTKQSIKVLFLLKHKMTRNHAIVHPFNSKMFMLIMCKVNFFLFFILTCEFYVCLN